jgi:hypothetical protein
MTKILSCVAAGLLALTLPAADTLAGSRSKGRGSKSSRSKHVRHTRSSRSRVQSSRVRSTRPVRQVSRTRVVRVRPVRQVSRTRVVQRVWVRVHHPRVYFRGRLGHRWALRRYLAHFGRICYYDRAARCWFYWCGPENAYYPVSYMDMAPPDDGDEDAMIIEEDTGEPN